MGVSPIPRNYSLFYEAYIGSNPALTKDLAALGNRVTQEDLDELSSRYGEGNPNRSIDDAQDKLRRELEALLGTLKREQSSIENYNRILGETRQRIDDKNAASNNILRNAISLLADATGSKIIDGEKTFNDVNRHAEEMHQVRLELDEYKRIANTDSLTRLSTGALSTTGWPPFMTAPSACNIPRSSFWISITSSRSTIRSAIRSATRFSPPSPPSSAPMCARMVSLPEAAARNSPSFSMAIRRKR